MSVLFDDISRLVASPLPRRRLIAMIGRTVAGSAIAAMWPGRSVAVAQTACCTEGCDEQFTCWSGCSVPGMVICGHYLYNSCDEAPPECRAACFCKECVDECPWYTIDCDGICHSADCACA
jgi:hypothetical protein